MRSLYLPLLVLLSLLTGCAGQPTRTIDSHPSADTTTRLISFESFGEALEQSMIEKDTSLFVEHFDTRQFARRSLGSLGLAAVREDTVNTYAALMGKALKERFTQTFSEVKAARYLRQLPAADGNPDESIALIRIQPEDGGINYWKVNLRRSDGQIRVVDWFSYGLGDLASRSLGQFILQVGVAAVQPDSPGADGIKAYLAATQTRDPAEILKAYKQLPANLQRNSLLMFSRIQAAMQVSNDVYQQVLADMAPLYEKNDNYALMLVDYYIQVGEPGKAHRAIDQVAASIGGDAGLDSLHAGLASQAGDYKRAIAYARDGISREADYEDNYWVLLDALVFSENYDDAVLVLNILEQGFHYQFDSRQMATLEGYEAFARSSAFANWRSASAY